VEVSRLPAVVLNQTGSTGRVRKITVSVRPALQSRMLITRARLNSTREKRMRPEA